MNVNLSTPSLDSSPNRSVNPSTSAAKNKPTAEFSEQELQQLKQLKSRDRTVRAHESAHIAAGGNLVHGGAQFDFQRGADGVQYAVGGEVKIDTAKIVGNPEATLEKANQIQAAALAPAQPSSQDRAVAAQAAQMAIEARAEISKQHNDEDVRNSSSFSSRSREESSGNAVDLTV